MGRIHSLAVDPVNASPHGRRLPSGFVGYLFGLILKMFQHVIVIWNPLVLPGFFPLLALNSSFRSYFLDHTGGDPLPREWALVWVEKPLRGFAHPFTLHRQFSPCRQLPTPKPQLFRRTPSLSIFTGLLLGRFVVWMRQYGMEFGVTGSGLGNIPSDFIFSMDYASYLFRSSPDLWHRSCFFLNGSSAWYFLVGKLAHWRKQLSLAAIMFTAHHR